MSKFVDEIIKGISDNTKNSLKLLELLFDSHFEDQFNQSLIDPQSNIILDDISNRVLDDINVLNESFDLPDDSNQSMQLSQNDIDAIHLDKINNSTLQDIAEILEIL